jgi:uncharacterized protein YxjI
LNNLKKKKKKKKKKKMTFEISVVKPETVILTTDERFIKDEPTILVLEEKVSYNGATCVVMDTNKKEYFKCKSKSALYSDGKILKDMNGAKVLGIRSTGIISFKHEIYNPKKAVGTVTKGDILSQKALKLSFHNKATHSDETLVMKFNSGSKEALILYGKKDNAPLVGRIHYKSNIFKKNCYYIEVAPKVDLALMTCFAIAFDVYKHE